MNRRSFLGSILVACAAPAIVRADSLMRIVPRETLVAWGSNTIEMETSIELGPITATEVEGMWRAAMLRHAERMCNPPIMVDYIGRVAAGLRVVLTR